MHSRLRKSAQDAFLRLNLPRPLTLDMLIMHISVLRGKTIQIFETEKLKNKKICGLWIPREDREIIYHALTRSPLHRQQMVLHELSHMILAHDESAGTAVRGIQAFKELSGETVTKALARGDFRSDQEVAAEYLADYLASALRESTNEIRNLEVYFE